GPGPFEQRPQRDRVAPRRRVAPRGQPSQRPLLGALDEDEHRAAQRKAPPAAAGGQGLVAEQPHTPATDQTPPSPRHHLPAPPPAPLPAAPARPPGVPSEAPPRRTGIWSPTSGGVDLRGSTRVASASRSPSDRRSHASRRTGAFTTLSS